MTKAPTIAFILRRFAPKKEAHRSASTMSNIKTVSIAGALLAGSVMPAYAAAMDPADFWSNYGLGVALLWLPALGVCMVIALAVATVMRFNGGRSFKQLACVAAAVTVGFMLAGCAALAMAILIAK